jgi:hypothetical protein
MCAKFNQMSAEFRISADRQYRIVHHDKLQKAREKQVQTNGRAVGNANWVGLHSDIRPSLL